MYFNLYGVGIKGERGGDNWHMNTTIIPDSTKQTKRDKKSLRHVAMVAKFWDGNKQIKSLLSLFALFQTSPILFNFI